MGKWRVYRCNCDTCETPWIVDDDDGMTAADFKTWSEAIVYVWAMTRPAA